MGEWTWFGAFAGNRSMKRLLAGRLIRWAGIAITALAIGLVIWSIYTSELLDSDAWKNPEDLLAVAIAAAIFVPSLLCVAAAWYLLVVSLSKVQISWLEGYSIYAVSAIYRYIPSNIVHYVGRYYMLRQRGVEHSVVAWSILAETALLVSASTLVALTFGAPLIRQTVLSAAQDSWLLEAVAILAIIVLAAAAVLIGTRRGVIRELARPFLCAKVVYAGISALLLNVAARVISGVALWWLAAQLLGSETPSAADTIAIWAAAWLLGYITPGASAGLGIREAVIIASLSGLGVPMVGATLVAIAFRVTTTISDLIFAGSGWVSRYFIRSHA